MNKNCFNNKNITGLHATILMISYGSMQRHHNLVPLTSQKRNFSSQLLEISCLLREQKYYVQMLK